MTITLADRAFWDHYDELLAERKAAEDAAHSHAEQIVVLEPGRELSLDEIKGLKGALGSVVKRVLARDWEVRMGVSVAQMPAVLYENSSEDYNVGDIRYAAYRATLYEVLAHLTWHGKVFGFHATWMQKDAGSVSFQGARTTDPLQGEVWRSTASKPRQPREWEEAEGVNPPDGFTPWLKMFAATDAEIRKKKREKEAVNG